MESERVHNKKVLIVEDETFLTDLLSMKFGKEGYELLHATDGKKAMEIAEKEQPDVILLDLVLPDMDGFEVLKSLVRNEQTTHIPVVVLSNLGQESDVEKGKEIGAREFLIKANFGVDEVVGKVKEILSS